MGQQRLIKQTDNISDLVVEKEISLQKELSEENESPRVFGLHAGQCWISEDFDEPLSDAFWLGEE